MLKYDEIPLLEATYLKRPIIIIIAVYVLMQLSGAVGPFILDFLHISSFVDGKATAEQVAIWAMISFGLGTVLIGWQARQLTKEPLFNRPTASIGASIGWGLLGIVLALLAQGIAANIEQLLYKPELSSENTKIIAQLAKASPLMLLAATVFGPIMEEIIFRRILFGEVYKRTNFLIALLVSASVFSIIHGELSHFFLYAAAGSVFAFLYYKTNRLLVPIIAHVGMNSAVMLVQLNVDKLKIASQFVKGWW